MRILTGIQPSGIPHIGNYFGAIKQTVEMQNKGENFLFIADYHALTTYPKAEDLRSNVMNLALSWLACGVDPERTVFFRQSDIPEVCELSWILATFSPVGLMERAHSYKDKVAKGFEANCGLFTYPILMSADILLYRANLVPVGKDQKQHLEIARDLALKFNNRFGDILTIPEELIPEEVAVVPGIDGQKMSKSYNNTIPIFDKEKALRKVIMSVVTDSKGLEEPKDPDSCNVYHLYKLVATPEELQEMRERMLAGNYGYGHAKQALFEKLWAYFEPMRKRREELENNLDYVRDLLKANGEKARNEAAILLDKVRSAVGLR